ncbi:unnamed protein product [Meloidogyne enterolobii]|uniref:Uncharacterized protein n=1 Tax=Meloidogyne enterolobii TaxID=390850 RepID=A0ACB0XT18_MELEN
MIMNLIENGLNIRNTKSRKENEETQFLLNKNSETVNKEENNKKYLPKKFVVFQLKKLKIILRKNKFRWQLALIGVILFCFLITFLLMMEELDKLVDSGKKFLKLKKDCSVCKNVDIIGDKKYIKFEYSKDSRGCVQLNIQCGLPKGSEAILQWYNGEQNMGVSFMEYKGQSNIRRMLNCNNDGFYELEENKHKCTVVIYF